MNVLVIPDIHLKTWLFDRAEAMIEELDKAYGDRALMAGIRFGVDEFCKRFDIDEKYKKRIEEIKRR